MDTEFREAISPGIWTYFGVKTMSDLSVRLRVWAAELDRLGSLGFELREFGPNCWAIEGPNGDDAVGGDDEGQE